MRRLVVIAAVAATAIAATLVPVAAFAGDDDAATIGVRLDFTSETDAKGSFSVCCSVTDSGAARAEITSFSQAGGKARFEATNTFEGAQGSFTILIRGTTGALGSPVHVAHGRWHVIDGSGAYAGLAGEGRLTAVTNQDIGALTAIDEGELQPGGPD